VWCVLENVPDHNNLPPLGKPFVQREPVKVQRFILVVVPGFTEVHIIDQLHNLNAAFLERPLMRLNLVPADKPRSGVGLDGDECLPQAKRESNHGMVVPF
jgi:hypothetical protein